MQPGLFTAVVYPDRVEYTSRITNRLFTLLPVASGYQVEGERLLILTDSQERAQKLIEIADTLD